MTTEITTSAEIVAQAPAALELAGIDTPALRAMLADAIGLTENSIRKTAAIWMELINRGEDLSDVRFALAPLMPAVAQGTLVPSLVVMMAGQTRSLQRLAELPPDVQADLAAGRTVPILKPEQGVVHKTIRQMSFPELAAVIRDGEIQSLEAQRQRLSRAPAPRRKSTVVEIRLAPDTYNDAARAAADAGMALEDYLRRVIVAGMRRG